VVRGRGMKKTVKRSLGGRSGKEDARVCLHEAAHLVASFKLGLPLPQSMSVEPLKTSEGSAAKSKVRESVEKRVIVKLAGFAAECHRCRLSLSKATGILKRDALGDDIFGALIFLATIEPPDGIRPALYFIGIWEKAYRMIGEWWPGIRLAAEVLQERRTLNRKEIAEVCKAIDKME